MKVFKYLDWDHVHAFFLSISLSLHNEYYYYCTIFENMRRKKY